MKIGVEFTLTYRNEEVEWKIKKYISKFLYQLKKYNTGKRFGGNYIYRINQEAELYKEIINFYNLHKSSVEFICLNYDVIVPEEEFKKAQAYILCFPEYYSEEYEDVCNEYNECDVCHKKEKEDTIFYVQPKGYIKKHENDCGIAALDGTGELILLPKLVEKLQKEDIDQKYFQPVISKSKRILGYIFVTDNILPQSSYIDDNYIFRNRCEKCGSINMEEDESVFQFQQKYITKSGVKKLKDVNLTCEFFDGYREMIISKKVAEIIKENVPYAEFYPVFMK